MTQPNSLFFKVATALLVLILIGTSITLVRTFSRVQKLPLRPQLHHLRPFRNGLSASSTPAIASIDSWMTFSYIERVFHLPPGYLPPKLPVTDAHYPRITIKKYAAAHGLSVTTTIATIKQAILQSPTSSPVSTSSLWN